MRFTRSNFKRGSFCNLSTCVLCRWCGGHSQIFQRCEIVRIADRKQCRNFLSELVRHFCRLRRISHLGCHRDFHSDKIRMRRVIVLWLCVNIQIRVLPNRSHVHIHHMSKFYRRTIAGRCGGTSSLRYVERLAKESSRKLSFPRAPWHRLKSVFYIFRPDARGCGFDGATLDDMSEPVIIIVCQGPRARWPAAIVQGRSSLLRG
jgi:hypothetical protein